MKFRFGMNRKNIIITAILLVVAISIYIWASTTFINEMNYRKRAFTLQNSDPNILDWKNAKVTLIKVKKEPFHTPEILSAKINKNLLFLNGGYAVKVEMKTNRDDFFGPSILYFNPFTKQCVGGVLLM